MTRLGASLRGERACVSFHAALAIIRMISSPPTRHQWNAEQPFAAIHIRAATRWAPLAAVLRSHRLPPTAIVPDGLVVEGPAARAAKIAERERGNGVIAVAANRRYSPLCPCKTPPNFYHPDGAVAGGMAPDYSSP